MKIERMVSKKDLMVNLIKAANYGKIEELDKLGHYIATSIELPDLSHNLQIEQYEIKISEGNYQIVNRKTKYNADTSTWELIDEQIVKEIAIDELDYLIGAQKI